MAALPELPSVFWGILMHNQFRNRVSSKALSQLGSETLIHAFMKANLDYYNCLSIGSSSVSHWKIEKIAHPKMHPLGF